MSNKEIIMEELTSNALSPKDEPKAVGEVPPSLKKSRKKKEATPKAVDEVVEAVEQKEEAVSQEDIVAVVEAKYPEGHEHLNKELDEVREVMVGEKPVIVQPKSKRHKRRVISKATRRWRGLQPPFGYSKK